VLNFSRLVPPLDTFAPATTFQEVTNSTDLTYIVTPQHPASHSMNVRWFVNGVASPDATNNSFTISSDSLLTGTNVIRAEVTDPTSLVRTDPKPYLKSVQSWTNRVGVPLLVTLTGAGRDATRAFHLTIPGSAAQNYVVQAPVI